MLVPDNSWVPPPGNEERMRTPGAAISTSPPKLLELHRVSSAPAEVDPPMPPGFPSVSTRADTVITSVVSSWHSSGGIRTTIARGDNHRDARVHNCADRVMQRIVGGAGAVGSIRSKTHI